MGGEILFDAVDTGGPPLDAAVTGGGPISRRYSPNKPTAQRGLNKGGIVRPSPRLTGSAEVPAARNFSSKWLLREMFDYRSGELMLSYNM